MEEFLKCTFREWSNTAKYLISGTKTIVWGRHRNKVFLNKECHELVEHDDIDDLLDTAEGMYSLVGDFHEGIKDEHDVEMLGVLLLKFRKKLKIIKDKYKSEEKNLDCIGLVKFRDDLKNLIIEFKEDKVYKEYLDFKQGLELWGYKFENKDEINEERKGTTRDIIDYGDQSDLDTTEIIRADKEEISILKEKNCETWKGESKTWKIQRNEIVVIKHL
jgi:hypothetical protein